MGDMLVTFDVVTDELDRAYVVQAHAPRLESSRCVGERTI
jgi:hypothetical protein